MEISTLLKTYNRHKKSDFYMLGFSYNGKVYITIYKYIYKSMLYVDKASRDNGFSLRYQPTNKHKRRMLKNKNTICLGSVDKLINNKYNKGEMLEKLIYEYYNQSWKKDNTPFYIDSDITINGIKYQIKYERATLLTSKQMKKLNKSIQ